MCPTSIWSPKSEHTGSEAMDQWIAAFLSNRCQCVVVRNRLSKWKHFKSGVPQGSIFEGLLLLFYVNDKLFLIQNTAKMSADITKLYSKINSTDSLIRHADYLAKSKAKQEVLKDPSHGSSDLFRLANQNETRKPGCPRRETCPQWR